MAKIRGEGAKKVVIFETAGEGKRCPFLSTFSAMAAAVCIKEECMLWNEEEQDCNINVIAQK